MPSTQSRCKGSKDNVFRSVTMQEEVHGFIAIGKCLPPPQCQTGMVPFLCSIFRKVSVSLYQDILGGAVSSYACAGPVSHCSIVTMGEGQ